MSVRSLVGSATSRLPRGLAGLIALRCRGLTSGRCSNWTMTVAAQRSLPDRQCEAALPHLHRDWTRLCHTHLHLDWTHSRAREGGVSQPSAAAAIDKSRLCDRPLQGLSFAHADTCRRSGHRRARPGLAWLGRAPSAGWLLVLAGRIAHRARVRAPDARRRAGRSAQAYGAQAGNLPTVTPPVPSA